MLAAIVLVTRQRDINWFGGGADLEGRAEFLFVSKKALLVLKRRNLCGRYASTPSRWLMTTAGGSSRSASITSPRALPGPIKPSPTRKWNWSSTQLGTGSPTTTPN